MSNAPSADTPAQSLLKRIDWTNTLFIGGYHLALFILLPVYLMDTMPSWTLILGSWALWTLSLMAITTGYHRLYSHRTYNTNRWIESVLLFFGTMATQGSVLQWSSDHRMHHKHVDSDNDPYNVEKGFWHAHMLWMFTGRREVNERWVHDLIKDPVLRFQHRYFGVLMVAANAVAVLALWALTGDLFGAFVIGFLLRLFLVHHCTWFINSLAHMWGSKPYSTEHSAVNNFILSFLTFGEGYHNYHHTFAGDYRNGVRWYQFDPPKYVIWVLNKLGLARDLKQVNHLTIRRKLIKADLDMLVAHVKSLGQHHHYVLVHRAEEMAAELTAKYTALKTASDAYHDAKKRKDEEMVVLRARIKDLKQSLGADLNRWRDFVNETLEMKPALEPARQRA
jgi:stearoyl-CoA desaturase (delta-9 desaturase)